MVDFHRDWLNEISSIQKEMERLLDHYAVSKPPTIQYAKRAWEPPVDLYESGNTLVVIAELAGVDEKQLQIIADRNTITIRGERPKPGSGTPRTYSQMEIASGPFERVIPLPFAIDADQAQASYDRGMLEITAPKSKYQPSRTVYIRVFHQGGNR